MAACSSPTLLSRKVILRTRWSVRKSKTKPGGWQLIVREHLLRRSTDSSPLPGRLTVKRTCEICCLERSSYDPTRTIGLMRPQIELADDRKSGHTRDLPCPYGGQSTAYQIWLDSPTVLDFRPLSMFPFLFFVQNPKQRCFFFILPSCASILEVKVVLLSTCRCSLCSAHIKRGGDSPP